MDRPMTSCACCLSRSAATEESTPPDMATAMRMKESYQLSAISYQLSAISYQLSARSCGNVAVPAASCKLRTLRDDQHQRRAADGELTLILDARLLDRLVSHERAVGRAEVDQGDLLAGDFQGGMLARDLRVVDVDVGVVPADDHPRLLDRKDFSRLRSGDHRQGQLGRDRELELGGRRSARRSCSGNLADRFHGASSAVSQTQDRFVGGSLARRVGGIWGVDLEERKTLRAADLLGRPPLKAGLVVLVAGVAAIAGDDHREATSARGREPAQAPRAVATRSGSISETRASSSRVVRRDNEKRTTPRAASAGIPSERMAGEGDRVPLEQALPTETATPARSSAMRRASPATPSKRIAAVLGSRGAVWPITRAPETRERTARSKSSRRAAISGASRLTRLRARRAAAPNPTMPTVFSVPGRTPFSCPPPAASGSIRTPRRTKSAPTPLGPWSLCAENDARSATQARRSTGMRPAACTASVWKSAPCRCAAAAASATGKTPPYSLLAAITETSAVSPPIAAERHSGSRAPEGPGATREVSNPARPAARSAGPRTDGCSAAVVTTRPGRGAVAPRIASALASVPPEVKKISSDRAPTRAATSSRASSTARRARRPGA